MQGRIRPAPDASQQDPAADHDAQASAWTGLEESMWPLSLEGRELYPERTGEPDCAYYMRTGVCGYGGRCRFNHPRDRSQQVVGDGEYPERIGQPVCQYYMKTGACKYGATCKYHHPKRGDGSIAPVELNYYGFPLRPGEKECSYYMKTGHCKFGVTCKFHHPQESDAPMPTPAPALYPQMLSSSVPSVPYGGVTSWQVARPPLVPGSYVQGPYGTMLISPGVMPMPSLTSYPPPVTPVASGTQNVRVSSFGLTRQLSSTTPAYRGNFMQPAFGEAPSSSNQKKIVFPERPGEPECQYYMRTGDCKYGSMCRYHHPRNLIITNSTSTLSPIGLPVRPGAPHCSYYAQHGVCKFGPTCKFDHPMDTLSYSPSASSLAYMSVTPYFISSSRTALAPSSLSSELRPEGGVVAGSNRDSSFSAGVSSSSNSVSVSMMPVPQSHGLVDSVPSSKGIQGSEAL